MKRTRAQRHWIRKGYLREMAPLRKLYPGRPKEIYLMGASEDWRSQRELAGIMGMPIRPVAKHYIHNGRKP